jgi:hypothetical protein
MTTLIGTGLIGTGLIGTGLIGTGCGGLMAHSSLLPRLHGITVSGQCDLYATD